MKKITNKLFKKEISKNGLNMTLGGRKLNYTFSSCSTTNLSSGSAYDCGDASMDPDQSQNQN